MKEAVFVLEEFFIEGKGAEQSHILLNISEPSSNPLGHGYFFALCEITNPQERDIENMQNLIDILEESYCTAKETTKKSRLEHAIETTNKKYQYQKYSKKSVVHFFVGSLEGSTLHFSTHNTSNAELFYQKDHGWKSMSLAENNETEPAEQFFSAISEGNLRTEDILYISSNACKALDKGNITPLSIITSKPNNDIIEHITHTCKKLNQKNTYAGMVIYHTASKKPINHSPVAEGVPHPRTLETDHRRDHKKGTGNKKRQHLRHTKKNNRHQKTYSSTEHVLIFLGKMLVLIIRTTLLITKSLFVNFGKIIRSTFLLVTNHGGQRKTVLEGFKDSIYEKKAYLNNLPTVSKILFILCVTSGIIFLTSITFIKYQEKRVQKKQAQRQLIQAIEDKYTAAQASLIYNNEEKALALLSEAQSLLQTLPENKTVDEKKGAIKKDITALLQTLQKITVVNPTPIFPIADTHPSASVIHIEKIGDTLIATDQNNTYYRLNKNSNIVKKETTATKNMVSATTPKEADQIIFLSTDNTISVYNPQDQSLAAKDISFPKLTAKIADISIYNRKLYTLDTAESKIYKHSQTQTGYDKGSVWTKDTVDLSAAVSLTIDGNIYVLKEDGEILKLTRGKKVVFSITRLSPPLTSGTEIWTYNEVPHLFILDTQEKRIIMANKDGEIITQFTSPVFEKPESMIVDYEEKTIYILDSNTIYTFPISV